MDHCPPPVPAICEIMELGELKQVKCTMAVKCTDGTDAIAKIVLKPVTEAKQMLNELERLK